MSILNIRPALNMIHMKLKCLCIAMETVTRVKRQASKWEENVTPLSTEQEIDIQNKWNVVAQAYNPRNGEQSQD